MAQAQTRPSSIDPGEIQNFSQDAAKWWDESGPFAPLHRLNPVRLSFIKEQICAHFGRDYTNLKALKGLKALDIGCGGGLVCEPLARMGADVTGIDADAVAIDVAKTHAQQSELKISYKACAAEDMNTQFDIVTALEIIEHVTDPAAFVQSCAKLVKPGGMIVLSTLNRTPKSFLLGIVAAEYMLGWVPRGTHNWRKFIRPAELSRQCRAAGLNPHSICGLMFHPIEGKFTLSKTDLDVNYFLVATKPEK